MLLRSLPRFCSFGLVRCLRTSQKYTRIGEGPYMLLLFLLHFDENGETKVVESRGSKLTAENFHDQKLFLFREHIVTKKWLLQNLFPQKMSLELWVAKKYLPKTILLFFKIHSSFLILIFQFHYKCAALWKTSKTWSQKNTFLPL